jgi:hypothetical protein
VFKFPAPLYLSIQARLQVPWLRERVEMEPERLLHRRRHRRLEAQ